MTNITSGITCLLDIGATNIIVKRKHTGTYDGKILSIRLSILQAQGHNAHQTMSR